MNTLTQQQINQYQWQVADGVARIVNPHTPIRFDYNGPTTPSEYILFEEYAKEYSYHTNAPDGIYSGEAFEIEWQYNNNTDDNPIWNFASNPYLYRDFEAYSLGYPYHTRLFLRLKPSHLPAVLTTQPGEEWKDRYREVWLESFNGGLYRKGSPMRMRYFKDFDAFVKSLGTAFKAKREWHLITPPAEQEAETVEQAAKINAYQFFRANVRNGDFDGQCYYNGTIDTVVDLMESFAKAQPQSTLTQKDHCIAELEQMLDQCQKNDLYFEQEKEQLNNKIAELENKWISITIKEPELYSTIMIADLIMGGVAIMDYDKREQLQFFKYWMPLPTPPQH